MNLSRTELQNVDAVWRNKVVTEADVDTVLCKQVAWELCELNFLLDLMAVDSIIIRREGPDVYSIAVRRSELIRDTFFNNANLNAMDPPADGEVLGADTLEKRVHRVEALRKLMQNWINVPDEIKEPLYTPEDGIAEYADRIEEAVIFFYVQTFIRHAGRPPVLPRLLP